MLSTRTHVLEGQAERRSHLKVAVISLKLQIEAYHEALLEADTLAHQQYANAVELKTRIGRRQLQDEEIPEGITEALNRDRITQLEADTAALRNDEAHIQQQFASLFEPNETARQIRVSLSETIRSVGKRLDILKDLEKLRREFKRTKDELDESEKVQLQRVAAGRLQDEASREEQWLGLVPSEEAGEVTKTLQFYYETLLDLESKQANLRQQMALTERLIELAESEKTALTELLPFLQNQREALQTAKEKETVSIQAQFMPQKAADILNAFETKTGERLPTPPPIAEAKKEEAIAAVADLLFDRHTEVVAAQKWTRLFEQSLSAAGIDGEIGTYQDQLGALEAQGAAIQRHRYRLAGHPPSDIANLAPEEQPQTEADSRHMRQGIIGVSRFERSNIRQQAIIHILIRLASIVLGALVLMWIFNFFTNRASKRYQNSADSGSAQTALVLSFLKAFFRAAIWTAALIMILSTLGFNVTTIVAGLGIGGLAIAMAARETLADILGGIMIFVERPFVIGDTIQVGSGPVAKVVDMTWRTTKLLGTSTYYFNVPNSQVANSTIQNFTRDKPICDWVTIYVSAEHDPAEVVAVSNQALQVCDRMVQGEGMIGTSINGLTELGNRTVMSYSPWWYIDDYHRRGGLRGGVWQVIWKRMRESGIKLEIIPFEWQEEGRPDIGLFAPDDAEA